MVFTYDRDEPEETITLDRILDDLVICGTVNEVVDQILALREVTGDLGNWSTQARTGSTRRCPGVPCS
jgi:hypothetical protein